MVKPVSSSTVRAPRNKATLNSLLDQVNKMQKDNGDKKKTGTRIGTIRSNDNEEF